MEPIDTTEQNIFDLLDLKNLYLLKVDIFSRLDYKSLHTSRQVCKEWNQLILEEFWFSRTRRPMMKRRLLTEWKTAEPVKRTYNFPSTKGFYLACDNQTVCMGTRDNTTLLLGQSMAQVASLDCDQVSGGPEAVVQDEESQDVQLDMTDSHLVTVTGSGVVTVWRREDLSKIYQDRHHGEVSILGVSLVRDLLVTGGSHGSLAALTVSGHSVRLDWRLPSTDRRGISHINSDGVNVVVGTNVGMSVWDFTERTSPALVREVRCGQVCCCVIARPLVACTGLFVNCGVQIWDFLTGQKLRSEYCQIFHIYFFIYYLYSFTFYNPTVKFQYL